MNDTHNKKAPGEGEHTLEEALNRSNRELIHLGNFYHQRGYVSYAQEIYRALFKLRAEHGELCEVPADTRKDEAS